MPDFLKIKLLIVSAQLFILKKSRLSRPLQLGFSGMLYLLINQSSQCPCQHHLCLSTNKLPLHTIITCLSTNQLLAHANYTCLSTNQRVALVNITCSSSNNLFERVEDASSLGGGCGGCSGRGCWLSRSCGGCGGGCGWLGCGRGCDGGCGGGQDPRCCCRWGASAGAFHRAYLDYFSKVKPKY
jgi:hypothetical protein